MIRMLAAIAPESQGICPLLTAAATQRSLSGPIRGTAWKAIIPSCRSHPFQMDGNKGNFPEKPGYPGR